MLTRYVHPTLGLPAFKKFEPQFLAALRAWPQETEFTVTGLSSWTVATRMRDSLHGYRVHKWPEVDPVFTTLFERYDGQFIVSNPDAQNRVMFRHRVKRAPKLGTVFFDQAAANLAKHITAKTVFAPGSSDVRDDRLNVSTKNPATVEQLAHMKHAGEIECAVIFLGDVRPLIPASLVTELDLGLHFDAERNETVML